MRRGLGFLLLAGLLGCASAPAGSGGARSQIDVTLPLAPAAARARVLQTFAADGLAVTESTGDVVTGTFTDRLVVMHVRGTLVPVDSAQTRVVLTGFGTRPQFGLMPEAHAQVTSTTGGLGKPVWQRMERIAAALAAPTGGQ